MHRRLLSDRRLLLGLLLLLLVSPAAAVERTRWLHVRVQDGGPDGATVRVNVPLSLVDGLIPILEETQRERGATFRFDDSEIDRAELQRILAQLREAPREAEVLLEKDGDRVWFSRQGDRLQIRVEEQDRRETGTAAQVPDRLHAERAPREKRPAASETRILVPMKLAEALVSSPEMDLKSVIRSFEDDGEILIVDGEDDTQVRVWIDERRGTE